MNYKFGRRIPKDWSHMQTKNRLKSAVQTVEKVEKFLILPAWHKTHDQKDTSACVGFASTMMMAMINENQCRLQGILNPSVRYNSLWAWRRAKEADNFTETVTDDNEGTTVEAASKVLSELGLVLWENSEDWSDHNEEGQASYGIQSAKWARTVDEMRTAISLNTPITIGINWYDVFNKPEYDGAEYWIGKSMMGGLTEGQHSGHALCVYGASDERQAFRIKNSWFEYPEVWMPYTTMERLMKEDGEVMLPSDRIHS